MERISKFRVSIKCLAVKVSVFEMSASLSYIRKAENIDAGKTLGNRDCVKTYLLSLVPVKFTFLAQTK